MCEQPSLCVHTPRTQPPVALPRGLGLLSVLDSMDPGKRPIQILEMSLRQLGQ